jgi:hypothetical protein
MWVLGRSYVRQTYQKSGKEILPPARKFYICKIIILSPMKRTTILLVALLTLLLTSCMKEDHQVRFRNNYPLAIHNVRIGQATFGTVNANSASGYKAIHTGDFSISGVADNGAPLTGSGTLSGKGKHKWTVTLNSAGSISMKED